MRFALTIVFAITALAAVASAEQAPTLRERFESAVRKIADRQQARREMLGREYLTRLARFERTVRWRRQRGTEAIAERKRFEEERTPLRTNLSADPEVARLQAILAGAFEPLERERRDATFAVANAYLFRLAMAAGRTVARAERARLAREIGLPPAADGTSDITPAWTSRTEIPPVAVQGGGWQFDLGGLADAAEIEDARLRVVSVAEPGKGAPSLHRLRAADGSIVAEWQAPLAAYSIVTVDVTKLVAGCGPDAALELKLEPAAGYTAPDGGSPWSQPRLLVDDAAAAMAPRGADGALPPVEIVPPRPPED